MNKATLVLLLLHVCHYVHIQAQILIDDVCVECICRASSSCNKASLKSCSGDSCGIFHITRPYWIDAGAFTTDTGTDIDPFYNCATDIACATTTVKSYMARYAQDCDRNGVIDCFDYAAIHMQGGFGCGPQMPGVFMNGLRSCLRTARSNLLDIR